MKCIGCGETLPEPSAPVRPVGYEPRAFASKSLADHVTALPRIRPAFRGCSQGERAMNGTKDNSRVATHPSERALRSSRGRGAALAAFTGLMMLPLTGAVGQEAAPSAAPRTGTAQ